MQYLPGLPLSEPLIPPLDPARLHVGPNAAINADGECIIALTAADLAILQRPRLGTHWTVPALRVLARHYRRAEPARDSYSKEMFVREIFLGPDE